MSQPVPSSQILTLVRLSVCLLLSLFIGDTSLFAADPPAIKTVYPAGIQQGKTAEIKLNGKPGELPISVWSSCSQFEKMTISEKGDQLSITAKQDAPAGLHWLRFYNPQGSTPLIPFFVGTLPEISEKEPNNDITEAGKIESLPVTINGILSKAGEIDTYQVKLNKGETLVASVNAHHTLASPMDTILQILDEQRFVLAQNDDDHGNDSLLHFRAPQQGTYYVRIFCFPSAPNSTIRFAGGPDDIYRLTLSKTAFLAFQFEAWQAKQKKFVRTGWNLAPSQDSQFQQATDFLNAPGLHRLWSHRELQLPERIELSAGEQSLLKFPSTQFGLLQKESQTSVHSIDVKKNDLIRFRVLARAYGSMLDPVLFVLNADGKLQVQKDDIAKDNLDVDLTWKAPADGKYSLEVKDRYGHFGPRYFYLLHAEPEYPRFELTVEKESYVTSADKPLEIAVTVKRIAGYKGEITVRADSLPEGCVCESVNSAEKGDSAKKVILKVDTKNAKPFNGPIQINGEGNDEKKLKQIATVTLKVKDRVSQSIWLTVPAPAPAAKK